MKLTPERSGLNIVPFIDIMLVLLCIVLSISSFIAQGKIEVNLPSSSSQAKPDEKRPLMIEADATGTIYFDGKKLTNATELSTHLQTLPRSQHLQLRLDERCDFAVFISIIDALKAHAHDNFSIATKQI